MPFAVPDAVIQRILALGRNDRALIAARRREAKQRIGYAFGTRPQPGESEGSVLNAFAPGIQSPQDLPADYMPRWLAHLIDACDDGIADQNAPGYVRGLADRAGRWRGLGDDAWERIRAQFLIACVQFALDAATKRQPDPKPAYWDEVELAANASLTALAGEGSLAAASLAAQRGSLYFSSEAIGNYPPVDNAPADASWAAKCVVEAAGSAADSASNAWDEAAAYTVTSAANAVILPGNVGDTRMAYWALVWRLFTLMDAEVAAAKANNA